jgi:hypothetical protein
MITSKYLVDLIEEFAKSKKIGADDELVIYNNPGRSDVREILKVAKQKRPGKPESIISRFIVDGDNKTVYVWDGYYGTHNDGQKLLKIPKSIIESVYYFEGESEIYSGGSLEVSELYTNFPRNTRVLEKNIKLFNFVTNVSNWTWVDKYLPGFTDCLVQAIKLWKKDILDIRKQKP